MITAIVSVSAQQHLGLCDALVAVPLLAHLLHLAAKRHHPTLPRRLRRRHGRCRPATSTSTSASGMPLLPGWDFAPAAAAAAASAVHYSEARLPRGPLPAERLLQ